MDDFFLRRVHTLMVFIGNAIVMEGQLNVVVQFPRECVLQQSITNDQGKFVATGLMKEVIGVGGQILRLSSTDIIPTLDAVSQESLTTSTLY